jgi:hypothetical protein
VIHNADGGEVEQCGNGARCFMRFVREHHLTDKDRSARQTLSGVIEPRMNADGRVTVDMGAPVFEPARVPFDTAGLDAQPDGSWHKWHLALGTHAGIRLLFRSRCCRWATRTRCRWSTTSKRRRWPSRARRSSTIRAFRNA